MARIAVWIGFLVGMATLTLGGCIGAVGDAPLGAESGTGGATVDTGVGGEPGTGGAIEGTGGQPGTGGTGVGGSDAGIDAGGAGGFVFGLGGRTGGTGGRGVGGAMMTGTGGMTGSVCTSKTMWNGASGPNMEPGASCNSCHNHAFTIFGTVYPTAHEPNLCNGANGIKVVITGADGKTQTLTTNTAGNFYSQTAVAKPFSAQVTSGNGTRMMMATQQSGDCNSCHTQNGANSAPGRIMSP
jgi:hypothetical protein